MTRIVWGVVLVLCLGLAGAGCERNRAAGPVCGDGICEGDETPQTCEFDCEICVVDGVCDGAWGEDRVTCPDDCPLCNHDGVCEFLEGEPDERLVGLASGHVTLLFA